jgi:hypothetical protein
MNPRHTCIAILLSGTLALGLGGLPAFGQAKSDSVAEYQWSVTLSLGITSRGPESDIEKMLVASGFNQSSPASWLGPGVAHPVSRAGSGAPWQVALRYAIDPPFHLAIIVSNASKGEIVGYRDPFMYISVNYTVLTIGTAVYIQEGGLRLGVGPALSIVKSWVDDASTATKVGALIDVGLSLPAHSRFFFDINFQYCLIGKAEIGPYTARFVDSSATVSPSRVNFSGYFITVGVGVRF